MEHITPTGDDKPNETVVHAQCGPSPASFQLTWEEDSHLIKTQEEEAS